MKDNHELVKSAGEFVSPCDSFIVELDDRFEFGIAPITPVPTNGTACNPTINIYMCK